MTSWGLTTTQIELIRATFARFPEIQKAHIFGSRAMGHYKPGSDVDIALYGSGALGCTTRVSMILNQELPLAFHCDVIDYAAVDHPDFIAHIDAVGQPMYVRDA